MKLVKIAMAIPTLVALSALPAAAGAPDNPGEKGQIVNSDKAYWQDKTGDKNAWGKTVSGVAKGDNKNENRSLGAFLSFMAGGPNPYNDNGSGND